MPSSFPESLDDALASCTVEEIPFLRQSIREVYDAIIDLANVPCADDEHIKQIENVYAKLEQRHYELRLLQFRQRLAKRDCKASERAYKTYFSLKDSVRSRQTQMEPA